MTLLFPELFRIHALSGLDIVGEERDVFYEIQRSLSEDAQEESVAKAAHELKKDQGQNVV